MAATADGEQEYLRWGEFRFELDGEPIALQAYRGDPEEDRLWVPFRDATNGEATYGGGRYLDLEREAHRASDGSSDRRPRDAADRSDGSCVLDLNRAYNPYWAYDAAYECPMVPTENWLDVPVEAGEHLPGLPGDAGHESPLWRRRPRVASMTTPATRSLYGDAGHETPPATPATRRVEPSQSRWSSSTPPTAIRRRREPELYR